MRLKKQEVRGFLNNMDYTMIDEQIVTVNEKNTMFHNLDLFLDGIFSTKKGVSEIISSNFSTDVKNALVIFFEKNKVNIKNQTTIRAAISDLKEHLSKMPKVAITVPVDLNSRQVENIAHKIEMSAKMRPLIELIVDSNMLAGAIFEYNGKRGDYGVKMES